MATRRTKTKTYDPNLSPVGWYIGSVLLQFQELTGPGRGRKFNTLWENTHLIKARSIEQAYNKLVAAGKLDTDPYINPDGIKVRWRFRGIGMLLPIYEPLEDGSEILWTDHDLVSEGKIRRLRKSRSQLIDQRRRRVKKTTNKTN